MTPDIPGLMVDVNQQRFDALLAGLYRAPELTRLAQLEICLRQAWALIPEDDEELFFDNVRQAENHAKHYAK
jgi:hypothetical protein